MAKDSLPREVHVAMEGMPHHFLITAAVLSSNYAMVDKSVLHGFLTQVFLDVVGTTMG